MPCSDGQCQQSTRVVYESGVSHEKYREVEQRADWFEGAICAILSELERRGLAAEVIAESSRNGLIDIMTFWATHSNDDEARIAKVLHGYSKDEQAIMRKLLEVKNV